MLIHKLPFQKRRYEKLGIDINEEINKVFGNRMFGMSTIVAGGAIMGILFILITALSMLLIKITNLEFRLNLFHFITFVLMSFMVCHFFVFKKDKYLAYFEIYDKWTRGEKRKYGWISFTFTAAVVLLFVLSF
jgi:hypothetical protein